MGSMLLLRNTQNHLGVSKKAFASADHRRVGVAKFVNYVKSHRFVFTDERCEVNTEFFVDHSEIADMIANVSKASTWALGELAPGHEWLAFTFQSQHPENWTVEQFEQLMADQDRIVQEAYARMTLDTSHKWMKSAAYEVDFAIAQLNLPSGGRVLDLGCGTGRHAIEFAKRGYHVVGVDFVPRLIDEAKRAAVDAGVENQILFLVGDVRTLDLADTFDAVVCFYDVIGSFPRDADNQAIVATIARHLRPGGRTLVSVMNKGVIDATAIHRGAIHDNLATFAALKPSNTMQKSGEIFDPQYLFFDPTTSLVYRKEQFVLDELVPCELIVRDRRYDKTELETICHNAGIGPIWTRHVRMSHWDMDYPASDTKAKELLLHGVKQ